MTRDMLYLQCCPTDTRQREEVKSIWRILLFLFLSAIKNKKKPPVFALLRASFFLSTWTCYFFSPTGIIAYADQEINMQVILKQIKKSKLSPWFMPRFSKNGSVDRFIVFSRYTSLAIASFAMLNIVGYTNDISKTSVGMFPC